MPVSQELAIILDEAKCREKEYYWLEAAGLYKRVLGKVGKDDIIQRGDLQEKIGYCLNKAALQAEDPKKFMKLGQLAVEAYEAAAHLLEEEGSPEIAGKCLKLSAMANYIHSWLASSPSEKKRMLNECLRLGKKSLEAYEDVADEMNYGKMCNDLLLYLVERLYVASDWMEMKSIANEGINCANKAIAILSKLGDKIELLRAYSTSGLQGWYAANVVEEQQRKELARKSIDYSQKALELSRDVENPHYVAMANWAAAMCILLFTEKVESSLEYAKEMLRQGTMARDNYLKGVASYVLAFVTNWMTLREPDLEKKKEGHAKIIGYAEDAIRYLQMISQDFYIAETDLFYAESCSSLGHEFEASPEERRSMLEKAIEIGRDGLEHAKRSGSSDATVSTLHALSKALHFYSNLELGKDEKARLLEEALVHRQESNKIVERVVPTNDWVRGVGKNYEGLIKAALAREENENGKKRDLLESAVSDMNDGISRCRKLISVRPVPTLMVSVGEYEASLGATLTELYALTKDEKTLYRTIEAYAGAAKEFKKAKLPSRAAESYWTMAKNQDRLGKNQEAVENFENAFLEYKSAAHGTPHFEDFYLDHATYMKAWSEIEKAKVAHTHEKYVAALNYYEKVADLLKPLKLWSYLSTNFLAWSFLEQGEGLSRSDNCTDSIEAFKKAAECFEEATQVFEEQTEKAQNLEEKEKAIELREASVRRKGYCIARMNLEEARVYDRKGKHAESAEKYGSAATMLEEMCETTTIETDRKEAESIALMCRAWQKMKLADGRASPELYRSASEIFLEAKEHSAKDTTALLASGNSAFCKALEHGTRFEETKSKDDLSKAKQFLESAANYYLKAGFDNASLWTNATEILFDAYNYMLGAEIEVDLEKKNKAYLLAERCLDRSAGLYETAGFIGKRDEVLKMAEKVKEKSEFALSLGELLAVPSDASSTRIISAPGLNIEEPVGLLRFEPAFIQGNLIVHKNEVVVGENLDLEIQIANLGKNPAFLLGVKEILPEGFDLIGKPEKCLVLGEFLSLKGRRMAPLENEAMKLTLKPKRKGEFVFMPKIEFMDEAGEHKYFQLEQLTVTVKELGIRGWLKGPD